MIYLSTSELSELFCSLLLYLDMCKQYIFIQQILKTPDTAQIAEQLDWQSNTIVTSRPYKLISWGQDIQANKEEQDVCDEC